MEESKETGKIFLSRSFRKQTPSLDPTCKDLLKGMPLWKKIERELEEARWTDRWQLKSDAERRTEEERVAWKHPRLPYSPRKVLQSHQFLSWSGQTKESCVYQEGICISNPAKLGHCGKQSTGSTASEQRQDQFQISAAGPSVKSTSFSRTSAGTSTFSRLPKKVSRKNEGLRENFCCCLGWQMTK